MRKGRREGLAAWAMALLGSFVGAAPAGPAPAEAPVRMTVEVDWALPTAPAGAVELELTAGRIVAVAPVGPGGAAGPTLAGPPRGTWPVVASATGRVRARLEAPI